MGDLIEGWKSNTLDLLLDIDDVRKIDDAVEAMDVRDEVDAHGSERTWVPLLFGVTLEVEKRRNEGSGVGFT